MSGFTRVFLSDVSSSLLIFLLNRKSLNPHKNPFDPLTSANLHFFQTESYCSFSLSPSSSFYSTQSLSDLYIPCLSISVFILLLYLQSNGIPPAPSKRIFLGVTCECLWIELVLLLLVSQYELPVALSFLT